MNSILRQINQNNGNKSPKELLEIYSNLMDKEINRLYSKIDCVDSYSQHFQRIKENSRQYYLCVHNLCPFKTNKSSLIVRHIRRHLKQRPYICPIDECQQSFYQKCDLRHHLMRHYEDKPFKCHLHDCPKTYTTRKALSLHIKSHSPFEFKCKECHQLFATNWKLSNHIKQRHRSSLSDESTTQTSVEDINEHKPVPFEARVSPKVEPNTNFRAKHLTKQLMSSIDSVNHQMKDQLISKESIQSFSSGFGFEEVIKYVISNCGQPSNRQSVDALNQAFDSSEVSDRICPPNTNSESNGNQVYVSANQLLGKSVQNVCSQIEIYNFLSLDSSKKVLFKCINCVFTSDRIETIVGHVFEHISGGVTQYLRTKSI